MHNKTLCFLAIIAAIMSIQAISSILDGRLDLNNLHNYANQKIPGYVFSEETHDRDITDEIATLGRVLFYDKQLSLNSKIACAECHKQEFAFGDTLVASPGFDGELTERHSTRLVNLNFSHLPGVFWDRRAGHLDSLPLMVLSNSIEMGFSGEHGQPDIDSLVRRIDKVDYYKPLFELAYGAPEVTAEKMNLALTQFVRSIVSYDSKYDVGRSMVDSNTVDFPNFSKLENQGKRLFQSPFGEELTHPMSTFVQAPQGPVGGPSPTPRTLDERIHPEWFSNIKGKMGCADCHGIDNFTTRETSLTGNNGIISVLNVPFTQDTTVKRSPSLRDLITPNGIEIGPFMHDGSVATLEEVMEHYSTVGFPATTLIPLHKRNPNLHTSLDVTVPSGSYTGPASGSQGPSGPVGPGGWGWGGPVFDRIPHYLDPRIDEPETAALIAFLKTLTGTDIYENEKWSDPFSESGELAFDIDCVPGTRTIEKTICEGDSYAGFHISGLHQKRICQPDGCDSILNINLKVTQAPEVNYVIDLCEGDTFLGYDKTVQTIVTKPASAGCDTIVHLDLKLIKPVTKYLRKTICQGHEYLGYTEPGIHNDTLVSTLTGCDSIRTIRLIVTPPDETYEEAIICQGENVFGHDTDGVHIDTLKNSDGCNVLRVLDLVVLEQPETAMEMTICEDESYEGYGSTGLYTDYFTASNGCDSTRILDLTVNPKTESFHGAEICLGESFMGYTSSGSYTDHDTNAAGCDSTIYVELIVNEPTESHSEVAICEGESYEGYSEEGQYMDVLLNTKGCDSLRTISLSLLKHTESHYEMELCEGDSFEGYDEEGSYVDVMTNVAGCDSTRHISIMTLLHSESHEEVHLCPGEEYEGRTEGDYDELYYNSVGCDSIRYVSIINIDEEDAICSGAFDEEPNEITKTDYIRVGPNPTMNFLEVNIDKPERIPAELRIISSDHRIIMQEQLMDNSTRLDLTDMEPGVYIIHIQEGLNVFLTKVLKI